MINRFALMFFSTVAMWCGAANTDGCDIYLLIGQSNMSGRGALSVENALPNDRIVKFSKKKKWVPAREPLHFDRKSCGAGLAMSFARKMADASPARTIALVPCAVGGTPLQRWCPEGDLYSNAVVRARAALKKGTLKGILWHQGCADANNITNARTYAARLVPMVARLRKDIGAEDVPFVAGELPRFLSRYVEKNGHHHHWPIVNAQLAEAVSRIPHAALVSSEGLDDCRDDLIHFETPSLRKLGERYAEAMLRLQAEGKTAPENDHVKELPPFVVGADALDPAGGHVQGIAASEDALYISQMTRIVKLDWKGNVLATRNVQSHTGDIAWHDGELYTAVAVYPERKEGRIQVFDKDLNLLRETTIDRTIDGIAYADGVLLVGMGAKEQPSSKPHRVNILGRFDAKTLKEIAPRAEFEYGHDTVFGFQNIAFDSGCFIASFYSVKGSPEVAFFDRNLKVLGTAYAQCNQGFDILPKSMRADGRRFVRAKTTVSKSPPAVSCEFDFIELKRLAASQARIKPPEPNVMRTEANSPIVKEVRLEAQFVVSPETRIGGLTTGRIKVGSYNIRMSAADNGTSNAWDERKEDLADLIRKLDLDVFGMQEVCPDQEAFLRARLPDYGFEGDYRNSDRKTGEASPVCYRKSRFEMLDKGTFWLSETPDVPGEKGWDAQCPRICTYLVLRDRITGKKFCFANCHTDHRGAVAREKGLLLVVERMKRFGAGLPIVFTGDHNCRETDAPARAVRGLLKDAIYVSETVPAGAWRTLTLWKWRENEVTAADALKVTFEERNPKFGTKEIHHYGRRIDYIYVSEEVRVLDYRTVDTPRPGKSLYPSDHFPVVATLLLP